MTYNSGWIHVKTMVQRIYWFPVCAATLVAASCLYGQEDWKTDVPYTYLIDYSQGHVNSPAYLDKIREAPPTLMHVGEDVVFSSVFGTKAGFGGPQGTHTKLITAEEARTKLEVLRRYTAAMHAAGVKSIIPYINNIAILGDHVRRTGYWEFFDNWGRFQEFGFGPRPAQDIATAQMFSGFPSPERRKERDELDPNYPYKRYELCVNNPIWRNYLIAVTRVIAQTGMDGVFSDEMDLRDYCSYDQEKFRGYLSRRYKPEDLERRFGTRDISALRLGYPGEGALWAESQAFWSWSLGDYLRELGAAGAKENPKFFVMANLGPFAHINGAFKRSSGGKDPREWAPHCRLIMFEEMQRPGELGPGVFVDSLLQFKMAFGMRFRAGVLSYYSQDAAGVELSMAESGAGGGGAFIEGGYREPAARNKYRKFFESHRGLFAGYQSQADVAVVFDYGQAYWNSSANYRTLYPISQYLAEHHVLFDVIPPSRLHDADLAARYRAVITPALLYASGADLAALRRFAETGGIWLDIGHSGEYDDAGRVRSISNHAPAMERVGKGAILRRESVHNVLRHPRFALYMLTESQANDLKEVVRLYEATKVPEFPYPPVPTPQDLEGLIEKHAGQSLTVMPDSNLPGVKCNVWTKSEGRQRITAAHFVNYYTPIPTKAEFKDGDMLLGGPPEQFAPKAVKDIAVRLRIGSGKVSSVVAYDPDTSAPETFSYRQTGDTVSFHIPYLRTYRIVQIRSE